MHRLLSHATKKHKTKNNGLWLRHCVHGMACESPIGNQPLLACKNNLGGV